MLKKTKFSNFKNHFPICVFSLGLVFFIFLTMSVNVKAANSYTLPFNVDDYRSNNSLFPDDFYLTVEQDIINWFQTDGSGYLADSNYDPTSNVIIPGEVGDGYCYIFVASSGYFSDTSNVSSIYSQYLTYNLQPYTCFRLRYTIDSNNQLSFWGVSNFYSNAPTLSFFGSSRPTEYKNSGLNYQLLYPLFVNSDVYDVNDNLVITRNYGGLTEEEVFDAFEDGLDISSTISNNIDPALNDLQNQKGFFDNLIGNLKNFFNALNGWINNGFSTLIGNIKNFFGPLLRNIQNYLNTFKESFEVFKDKWDHFFEIINSIYNLAIEDGEFSLSKLISVLLVPSQEDISSAFSGTVFYSLYTGVNSCSKYLYTYVTTLFSSSPNTFVMTLPTFTFGGKEFRGLQISFDWFIPYKTYFDIIVSGFLIMGYIRFLAMWINNFFHGSGFIDHDVNNISARSDIL